MADEAKEVSPFNINKNFKSIAPDNDAPERDPSKARAVMPVMFTKPGDDVYASDDPTAAPIYSDFRAGILPADSDVHAVVEVSDPNEEEEIPSVPKDLSALASAASLGFRATTERQRESQTNQLPTVLPDDLPRTVMVTPTLPVSGSAAVKDNGLPKVNENSTQTSSSIPETKSGSSEQPAGD